jgi:hypothetical protein
MITKENVYEKKLVISIRELLKNRAFYTAEEVLDHSKDTFSQHDRYQKLLKWCVRMANQKVKA